MPQQILVDKAKFETLLRKMVNTPPLPLSEVRVAKPKPKKKKSAD
jgi:hypothetical protein